MAKTIEFDITGMTCDHCVNAVTNAIKETPGVSSAVVSLDDKKATVTGETIDIGAIVGAVAGGGNESAGG